jgi:hypothetical protein
MDYQRYIGEGPEATALIDECHARKKAINDAILAFQQRHGFQNSWKTFDELFGGPITEKEMSKDEARARGLKLHCRIDVAAYAYEPHLGCAAGKQLQAEIKEINKIAFDASKHILKATGMSHTVIGPHAESRSGQCIAHSTAGYASGKIVVQVPIGRQMRDSYPMPTPPPWLREAKESEVLALYGK